MTSRLSLPTAFAAQVFVIILMTSPHISTVNASFDQSQDAIDDVGFNLVPMALGSPYPTSGIAPGRFSYVFFQSEPVILELVLINHTKRSIPIAGNKGRWLDLIEWQIFKDETKVDQQKIKMVDRSAEIKLNSYGGPMSGNSVDMLTLGLGEGIKKVFSLVSLDGTALPFGEYKVSALLTPNSLGDPFPYLNRAIPAQADFIVKNIEGIGDQLSYYSHQVQRHFMNREYDKSEAAIKLLQKLHPNSLFAYQMLGEIYCLQGKPQEASESIKRAKSILENYLDKYHRCIDQKYCREDILDSLNRRIDSSRCRK